jgi:hypothetical protein
VLYNVTEGGKHEGCRFLVFPTGKLCEFLWVHPNSGQEYTLKVEHDPQACMYPHSLVQLLRDGQEVEGVK